MAKKQWTAAALEQAFNAHDAALRGMARFSPDVQGVMMDIDPKTDEPFGRVVLAKNGATKPSDVPAQVGGLKFKAEYNR